MPRSEQDDAFALIAIVTKVVTVVGQSQEHFLRFTRIIGVAIEKYSSYVHAELIFVISNTAKAYPLLSSQFTIFKAVLSISNAPE